MKKYLNLLWLGVLFAPVLSDKQYYQHTLTTMSIMAILSMGFNLVFGITGKLSLASSAFYALGAYGSAVLVTKFGLPYWGAILISLALSILIAVITGVPTLRLEGFYFAVATLALSMLSEVILLQWGTVTGGASGIALEIGSNISSMVLTTLTMAITAVIFILLQVLMHSPVGRAFLAIREGEAAAASLGIDTVYYKVLAFIISGIISAVAGIMYILDFHFINPGAFSISVVFTLLFMVVIGGLGSTRGAILGAFVLSLIPELLSAIGEYQLLVYGIIVTLVILFVPGGLESIIKRVKGYLGGIVHG
ncbi:hypothetical protein JCM15765_11430 [Paradesulfitobacterium aromaticivorans]